MLQKIWIVLGAVVLLSSAPVRAVDSNGNGIDNDPDYSSVGKETDNLFAPAISYVVDKRPNSVAVGDFDGDGQQDLVTANWGRYPDYYGTSVTVLLGNGDGTFAAAVSYAARKVPGSVAVGDFDGDGHQDLVVSGTVLLGNGDGSFPAGDAGSGTYNGPIAVGDLDGDGRQDLVRTAYDWYEDVYAAAIWLGRGDGTFGGTPCNLYSGCSVGANPISVAVGDFNGDGQQDVVTANAGRHYQDSFPPWEIEFGSLTVLLGNGDGTFDGATYPTWTEAGHYRVAVGDFNGDGQQDLVTATFVLTEVPDACGGDPDCAYYEVWRREVWVWLGRGDGTFAIVRKYPADVRDVEVGDINGDGRQDLVTANFYSDDVAVLLGHGDGTFAHAGSYAVGDDPWSAAVGDFNGDGRQDLVTANFYSDDVTVLLNSRPVDLDIKPDSDLNSINPHSRGVIPVAILGSDTCDVTDIDVTTLAFGPAGAPIAHLNGHLQDVNFDGITDLMLHFRTQDTGIVCGDESVTLMGETLEGQPIEGADSIQTVGCRVTRRPAIWAKDQDTHDMDRRDGPVDLEKR